MLEHEAALEQSVARLGDQVAVLKSDKNQLNQQLHERDRRLDCLEKESHHLRTQLQGETVRVESLTRQLSSLDQDHKTLQNAIHLLEIKSKEEIETLHGQCEALATARSKVCMLIKMIMETIL